MRDPEPFDDEAPAARREVGRGRPSLSAGRSSRRSRRRRRRRRASRGRSRRRGGGPGSPRVGHFQTHQRSSVAERRRLGGERVGQAVPLGDERGDARGAVGLGLAGVRVVLADVRGHEPLRKTAVGRQGRWRRRVSAACHRPAEYTRRPSVGGSGGPRLPDGRQPGAARVRRGRDGAVRGGRSTVDAARSRARARGSRRTARRASPDGPSPASASATAGIVARLQADGHRRREVVARARRTSAAPRPPSRCRRRRRRGPTRAGRGSAAGRRRPSTRRRPTGRAGRRGTASRGAACAASACRARGRSGGRVEAEVRPAVLVVDPGPRVDDARPEAEVVRLDEADRVAVGVDGGEVDRPAAGRVGRRRRASAARRGSIRARELGARRPGRAAARPARLERRVGEVRVAIGHRELGGLDPEVDPARVGRRRPARTRDAGGGSSARQDREQLEGDDARAVRRVGRDPDAAVVDRDRLARRRGVRAQVAERHHRPDVVEGARLPLAEVAVVEGVEAVGRERLERRGQRRQPDPLARSPRPAVRPVDGEEPGVRAERRRRRAGRSARPRR